MLKFPVPPEFLDVCSGIQFPSPPALPVEVVPEFVVPVVEQIEEEAVVVEMPELVKPEVDETPIFVETVLPVQEQHGDEMAVEQEKEEEEEQAEILTDPLIATEADGDAKEEIRQPASMAVYSRCKFMICG